MQEERIKLLINKYLAHTLTEEENQELDYFIRLHPSLPGLLERQGNEEDVRRAASKMADTDTGKNLDITLGRIQRHQEVQRRTQRIIGGTALILLFVGIAAGLYHWGPLRNKPGSPAAEVAAHPADIAPGGNRASLMLADGKKIWLDSVPVGPIAGISGANLQKPDSGTLVYTASSGEGIHTLVTPRAGTFKVILADGTRVWLNNESSLQYPSSFTGTERAVVLTGEAYFEVTKDAQRPFRVRIGEKMINVLGTDFNVSAYSNEKGIATTLLSGSVSLSDGEHHVTLKPGEQGVFNPGQEHADLLVLQGIDTENIIAWKEGKFYFFHADVLPVLRELSRWYNIEIEFQGPPSKRPYDFQRKRTNISLNEVLELLNLHYHWEGKKLIVTE
ncbi:MAG TPA: FecR domain-containing protein [Puia sp.]|nr:FecR domain-containing protein [Puia sp.]